MWRNKIYALLRLASQTKHVLILHNTRSCFYNVSTLRGMCTKTYLTLHKLHVFIFELTHNFLFILQKIYRLIKYSDITITSYNQVMFIAPVLSFAPPKSQDTLSGNPLTRSFLGSQGPSYNTVPLYFNKRCHFLGNFLKSGHSRSMTPFFL